MNIIYKSWLFLISLCDKNYLLIILFIENMFYVYFEIFFLLKLLLIILFNSKQSVFRFFYLTREMWRGVDFILKINIYLLFVYWFSATKLFLLLCLFFINLFFKSTAFFAFFKSIFKQIIQLKSILYVFFFLVFVSNDKIYRWRN